MLEALSDDLGFRIIDYLAQRGDAHSTQLSSELNATKDQVSKRIKTLVDAGLVTRGRPQTLIFPEQTLRTLDEIGRLQILARRQLLADVEDPFLRARVDAQASGGARHRPGRGCGVPSNAQHRHPVAGTEGDPATV